MRGAGALTSTAGLCAVALFGGGAIFAVLLEEVLHIDSAPLEPLFAAAVGGCAVLAPLAAIGGHLRLAAGRSALLHDAERATGAAPPPAAERAALQSGPHDPLRALGLGLLLTAFVLGVFAVSLWEREAWAWAVRGLLPVLVTAAVLAGAPLAIVARRGGRARERWRARVEALERRWRPGAAPVPRAPRSRSERLLRGAGVGVLAGSAIVAIPMLLRQPIRYIDPIRYDEPIERVIDGLLLLGALVIVVAAALLVLGWLLAVVRQIAGERAMLRELERGAPVPASRLDAALLDRSPGERAARGLGLLGWLALAVGLAPAATALLVSPVAAAPLGPLAGVVPAAIAALVLAWLLGARAAHRATERRTRIHALTAHDPRPAGGAAGI